MRSALLTLLFICLSPILMAQNLSLITWNISNLGKTKDATEIATIAKILKEYDVVAIQEVVAKDPAGARAVARIADELNRMGNQWDYRVSDPTRGASSQKSERYAFLWKTSKINLVSRPFLDSELESICVREPYIGEFQQKGTKQVFFVVNFHSRVWKEHPEQEIKYFAQYQKRLDSDFVFISGDFNLDEKHQVWEAMYQSGFSPCIQNSPTTLKRECKEGNYLNHSIDNIYYDKDVIHKIEAGRIDFVNECHLLKQARLMSDHLPVFLKCEIIQQ